MGGGELVYQQVPYFMLLAGQSAARVMKPAELAAWLASYLLQHAREHEREGA